MAKAPGEEMNRRLKVALKWAAILAVIGLSGLFISSVWFVIQIVKAGH